MEVSRQHPLSETLAQLSRLPVFMRLELKGLGREDTADFIRSVSGVRPLPQVVEAVYSHTEGNPFFMSQVVRLLSERAELASAEVSSPEDIGIPAGVREAIGQRLNRLSARCNESLSMASAIGRGFDFRLLRALTPQVTEDQLLEVIDEALGTHLIEGLSGGVERYQFSHALVQQTLSEALSASRRVRLHARIAEALEALYGADVEAHAAELAYHFAQAQTVLGTDKLVRYSLLAGEQALAAYGWEGAIAHYQTALELLEELKADPRQQAEVLEKLASVTTLGRGTGALGCLEKALAIYETLKDNKKAGGVHLRLVSRRGVGTLDARTRHSHGVKAVQLLEPEGESPQLSQAYVRLGLSAVHGFGGLSTGLPLMEKGLALAERLGETVEVIEGASALGHALVFHTGEIDRGLGLFRRGFEEAKKTGDLVALSETAGELSWQYAYLRDVQEALPWAEQAVDASKQAGTVGHQVESALELAWACILQGDASRARLSLETAEQVARKAGVETRSLLVQRSSLVVVPGLVNIFLGDWDKAETELLRLAEFADQVNLAPLKQFWTNPDLGWLCLERGDLKGAKAYLGESAVYCKTGGDNPPELLCRALLVQVCSKSGELEEATAHLRRARELFSLSPDWFGLAAEVRLAEGVMATAQQRWPEAEAAFQQAVAINQQYHLPYYEARSLLEWGQMYFGRNGRGDREMGTEFLDQAVAIFQRVQAKKMVEKALSLQEQAASQPARTPAYPDGLTHREVEVLRLIAAGRSNRAIAEELFISPNTAGHHVSNILAKTGAANRAEVAAYGARHGLLP
jgi:DNA-binding CsgD family transcriptional regulator